MFSLCGRQLMADCDLVEIFTTNISVEFQLRVWINCCTNRSTVAITLWTAQQHDNNLLRIIYLVRAWVDDVYSRWQIPPTGGFSYNWTGNCVGRCQLVADDGWWQQQQQPSEFPTSKMMYYYYNVAVCFLMMLMSARLLKPITELMLIPFI